MKTPHNKKLHYLATFILLLTFNTLNAQRWPMPPITHLSQDVSGQFALETRQFAGIPSMAVAPDGRLWATWYTGITGWEDTNNYVVLSTSGDGGRTWKEILVVDPDGEGPLRAFDSQLWMAPDNSLWFFYGIGGRRYTDDPVDTWFIRTENPDSENPTWSEQRFIASGVMMNKPTVLSTGEWLFPVALWEDNRWGRHRDRWRNPNTSATDNSAKVYVSRDKGATFNFLSSVNVPVDSRTYDEHQIVERKDGSLWMWIRTRHGIGKSVSTNRGRTWSEFQPSSNIQNPDARFFISRLASGNLLLVKNGPIEIRTDRSHIMAFISKDDGLTWSRGLLLAEGGRVSYPDGQQTKDGRIHITYDNNRTTDQMILVTSFTEEDILDPHHDAATIRVFNNRRTVSRAR
jgi:predicted neuraminidase